MKQKLQIFYTILVFTIVLSIVLYLTVKNKKNDTCPLLAKDFAIDQENRAKILTVFESKKTVNYSKLMELAKTGKQSIISEFSKLQKSCPRNILPKNCSQMVMHYFCEILPYPQNKHMVKLFKNYLDYTKLLSLQPHKQYQSHEDRFAKLFSLRRKFFNASDAELVFGIEEIRYKATKDYLTFLKTHRDTTKKQRQKFYKERKNHYYQLRLKKLSGI